MHMHLLEMEQLSLGDEIQIQICYNQRNGSRSEAQQSAQPPLKKIKLEQLDQPSSSDPATECLRCLPSLPAVLQQNISHESSANSSEPPNNCEFQVLEKTHSMSRDREQRDILDQDNVLCLLKEPLNNLNKILEHLKNFD